ncbi:MAG: hypothetical protein ACKV2T_17135 [Kofleriaceae bacterium]
MIDFAAHVRELAPRDRSSPAGLSLVTIGELVSLEVERARDDRRFRRLADVVLEILDNAHTKRGA